MDILCPVCKNKLIFKGSFYQCENRHSFDLAKEGYLNLNLKSSQKSGDNPEMIKARKRFLEKGYYDFLKEEINTLIQKEDVLLDLACGEGYYTKDFPSSDKIGIDLSKTGLKLASKNDKSTLYLLNSIFHNPIKDESADKIITIFAPVAQQEILRILKKGGHFILVRPDLYHLYELKKVIYDHVYLNEDKDMDIEGLVKEKQIRLTQKKMVCGQDIADLFMMTPYVNTTSKADKEKLKEIQELEISFSFIIDIYTKPY